MSDSTCLLTQEMFALFSSGLSCLKGMIHSPNLCTRCRLPCTGQEAFELHSKDTVNDSTYLLLNSLSAQATRAANIIKAVAINFKLARPDKDPGSFVSH